MIRSVHIENFRCIRDLTLELEPLTVLVGPNASGKSPILSAMDPVLSVAENDKWQRDAGVRVRRRVSLSDGGEFELLGGYHPDYRFRSLRLDPNQLRQPNTLQRADELASDGGNLANVFGTLTRTQQAELSKQFCQLVPMFTDVDVVPYTGGTHWLRFQDGWKSDVWYSPLEVSDGTLLVVAFLALQFQSAAIDVVGIEEPERGLHPYLIGELIKLLRSLATGAGGPRPIQFVLATHSAELLEFVRPEEVRFLDRARADGSVQVTRIDPASQDWQRAFKEYRESLGSAWLAGGLGGVPGAEAAE